VQVSGVTDRGLKPKKMKVVAVLGGGLMGSGIATALAWTGYTVLLKEVKQEFLDSGMKRIKANMDSRVKKKGMTPQARDAAMALIKGTLAYDGFKVCLLFFPWLHGHRCLAVQSKQCACWRGGSCCWFAVVPPARLLNNHDLCGNQSVSM
jgi:hypothetical protein